MSCFALGIYEGYRSEKEAVEEFTKSAEAIAHLEETAKKRLDRAFELLALEEQGRLVVLPCKVGDKLYRNSFICNAPVDGTRCDEYDNCDDCPYSENEIVSWKCPSAVYILQNFDKFGKTVFLTREEAEQALKEGK